MKILKFGGTSVGSAERMKDVAKLVTSKDRKIVVLSAMSGITNLLTQIIDSLYKHDFSTATNVIDEIQAKHMKVMQELYQINEYKEKAELVIAEKCDVIRNLFNNTFTDKEERVILAQGELMSTAMFNFYLQEIGVSSTLLHALNFMRIDENDEPDTKFIRQKITEELAQYKNVDVFITQGYICMNPENEIDNLKRGGSDYTATILGAAIKSDEVQIWTDIDGIHNNDPRCVENTKAIHELSFDEAAELAYFGAKILHPTCILPAKYENVLVRLKNTLDPASPGTLIKADVEDKGFKAVAAKDGIVAIKIKSGRMLLAFGFLRKIFEVFENHKTPIDMITTSEVAVSLTIDNQTHLNEIVEDLNKLGAVEVDKDQAIICTVGDFIAEKKGCVLKVLEAFRDIPIRMVSYGGSKHNISILIDSSHKKEALVALSNHLFN